MLGGRELLAVWELGGNQDPVRRAVTMLVAVRGGTADAAAEFDVGSRDVLLARSLRALAGGTVPACADCPGCGADLDVPVDVAAVAALTVLEPGRRWTARTGGAEVTFRLPTTADLLAVRDQPPRRAREMLVRRCLGVEAGPDVVAAVEEAMERAAPAGAVDLVVCCPACERSTAFPLDVGVLLWAEIQKQAAGLLRDVHLLASSYGWTEGDVLALSPGRRAGYLALVS
jgi:hypothetical protein